MAIGTGGTAAPTALSAVQWIRGIAPADAAAVAAAIKSDQAGGVMTNTPFTQGGLLYLPRGRGVIRLHPGDWVMYDITGWPIVLSPLAAASPNWVHNP